MTDSRSSRPQCAYPNPNPNPNHNPNHNPNPSPNPNPSQAAVYVQAAARGRQVRRSRGEQRRPTPATLLRTPLAEVLKGVELTERVAELEV